MNFQPLTGAIAATLLLASASTLKANDFDPKGFIKTSCSGCHDDSVYSRKKRIVKSMDALNVQIRRCDANVGTQLFDDDVEILANYLNDTYYHFGK